MAKDPAVLFYTSDFLTGTMMMTDDQVGKYIRLLCLQHQKGGLSEKDMMKICKTYDEDIFSKFEKEGDFFVNKRMKQEAEKRKKFSESRAQNRKKKEEGNTSFTNEKDVKNISSTYEKDMLKKSDSYVEHMENENENENRIINNKKGAKKKKSKTEEHLFSESPFIDFKLFEQQFTGTDYEVCDLNIYYESVKNWSASKGEKKKDWIATAKNFILSDKKAGKLILKPGYEQRDKKNGGSDLAQFGKEIDDLVRLKYGDGSSQAGYERNANGDQRSIF